MAGTPKPASTPVSAAKKKQDSSSSEDSSSDSEDEAPAKVLFPNSFSFFILLDSVLMIKLTSNQLHL